MPVVDLNELILPDQPERTPQRNENPRRAARLWRRDQIDLYRPEHRSQALALHNRAVGTPGRVRWLTGQAPTPLDLERKLIEHLGFNYCFDHRCDGTTHCHDCSGYQVWGMNAIGAPLPCTSSFVLAQMCYDHGLLVSYDDLYNGLPGWAFRGANLGRTSNGTRNGADGHIVYVNMATSGPWAQLPSGLHVPGTLEAMGHAYGVRRGVFDLRRQFTGFYRIIGLDYDVRSAIREHDMILQTHHFEPQVHAAITTVEGEYPYAIIAADGRSVECWFGASIANDQLDPHNPHLRRWVPKELGTRRIVGLIERFPKSGETPPIINGVGAVPDYDQHPGVLAVDDSGDTHRGHWS